jgi:DNA-binding NtrC family response regulator
MFRAPGSRQRMLIVDEAGASRAALRNLFWFYGYDASCARAVTAIEMMEAARYDIVLIEHEIPEGDACGLARQIRERWPRLPIVGTGPDPMRGRADFYRAGANAFVVRPFDFEKLTETVLNITRSRRATGPF